MKNLILIPAVALLLLFSLAACQEKQPEKDPNYQGSSIMSAPSLIEHFKKEPADIQELVNRSHAVVVGSISSVGELISEPPYNAEDFEDWPEDQRPTVEVKYYDISIEEVLLDDGYVEDNAKLRLAPIWPTEPKLNERCLFVLGRNPDNRSYGISATWNMLTLGGDGIRDLAGTAPGYVRVTDELSLVESIRNAVPNYDFLPVGEWPDRFYTGAGDAEREPSAPGGPDNGESGPVGNTGEGES